MSDEILQIIHEKVDKLDGKLDSIGSDIVDIKLVQKEHAADIKYHIMRSDLLEESVEILRAEIKPIQKHVTIVDGLVKFILAVVSIAGVIIAFLKFTTKS